MEIELNIINTLIDYARSDKSVVEMMQYIINTLNLDNNSRLIVIKYFREAFKIDLEDAKQLGAWDFFEGGTWNDCMIEAALKPVIHLPRLI